jgi:hypothetical protein
MVLEVKVLSRKLLPLETPLLPKESNLVWQIQQTINKEELREAGLMDSYLLQCSNRWLPRHPTVNMVEERL